MKIATIGTFQVGKSTLVNCLINYCIAGVGIGVPTTHTLNYYQNGYSPGVEYYDVNGSCLAKFSWKNMSCQTQIPDNTVRIIYELPRGNNNLKNNILIDTPGLDSAGKDASWDTIHTSDIIKDHSIDLLILVVPNKQLDTPIKNNVLPRIKEVRKKLIVLMNCNQNDPDPNSDQNQKTAMLIDEELRLSGIKHCSVSMDGKSKVLSCNFAWWWIAQQKKIGDDFGDQQTKMIFQERSQQIKNYFSIILRQAVPSDALLEQKSNLSQVFSFLNNVELRKNLWQKDEPDTVKTIKDILKDEEDFDDLAEIFSEFDF